MLENIKEYLLSNSVGEEAIREVMIKIPVRIVKDKVELIKILTGLFNSKL